MNIRLNFSTILLIFSVSALSFAYISQYFFGLEPCILCIYQRIPYFIIIALTILIFFVKSEKIRFLLLILCGITLLINSGIAFYHVGVEKGMFEMSCGNTISASSLDDLRNSLLEKPYVACDKPQFVFLGFSMAAWNLIICFVMGIITLHFCYTIYKYIKIRP